MPLNSNLSVLQMHPGKVLNILPDYLDMKDADDRACCIGLECYSCAFLSDITGLGAMQIIEDRDNRCDVKVFAKYIYSWPCRLLIYITRSDSNAAKSDPDSYFF